MMTATRRGKWSRLLRLPLARSEADAVKAKGFHLVSLGPTILRTETAAIAALSMIGYEFHS